MEENNLASKLEFLIFLLLVLLLVETENVKMYNLAQA